MPRGDKTGPLGQGPMTGRAAGFCAGNNVPGYANPAPGMGMAWGRNSGRGRGYRGRLNVIPDINPVADNTPIPAQTQEKEVRNTVSAEAVEQNEFKVLKEQVNFISKSLEALSEKLESMDKSTGKAE